jgi:hypothetical protein
MRTSLSSFRVAPRLRSRMANVWRRTIGETRHMPTSSQRFQMAFWRDLEVATGRAVCPF